MPPSKHESKTVILVVDNHEQICTLMKQRLRALFDRVITASDPHGVTRILEREPVTHLLCDYRLGVGDALADVDGYVFTAFWRREFPGIRRAVVFSGNDLSRFAVPPEVDEVVSKSDGIGAVIDALLKDDSEV